MKLTGKIGMVALAILVAAGCSKQEGGAGDAGGAATGPLGKDAPKGSEAGSAAGAASSQLLAGTLSTQVQQQQKQLDSLKESAKQYADQQLNGLLSQLDTELKSATAKVGELKSAGQDSAKEIQADLQDTMGQITDLVDQATARHAPLSASKP